jgi:hypothetical protein
MHQERRVARAGGRWIALGVPLVVIGIVLALLLNGNAIGIGVAIAVLGAIPLCVGVALMLGVGVERHARKGGPWA